ncbi:hypothetical protein TrispH2_001053 [Trichoplax sp. H2]|nr:hypothetical protein TrispH2_001053 [Trichoplax sp. H2]|eukprot:RDD46622.1 hypothetical protein TrispH2_001053 [Trichoplax sp. H2]
MKLTVLLTYVCLLLGEFFASSVIIQAKTTITIGALVEDGRPELRDLLQLAVDQVNQDQKLLPNVELRINYYNINTSQPYQNQQEVITVPLNLGVYFFPGSVTILRSDGTETITYNITAPS